ncbi:Retrovirus-related Pol polyprotein from transposon RE1 [Sesamum angolense]|uniref:Retrovirus-related Pol polyprotein from transposon RE1 n=1 Tax=Sesamum angolense TaxID=2727404 RepID=A0AAE1WGZ6_9LAMI|nr:Retrovirus-related Pol polyprotein from transposon RE1 [Sesamum angolense]
MASLKRCKGKKPFEDRRSQYCDHCERTGHTRETCFKLHGTPDWYKELNEQRKKQPTTLMVETTERRHAVGQPETKDQTLLQELMKLIKGSLHQEEQVNFAQTDDFAGEHFAFASYEKSVLDFWIVDTGATNHMCANPKLLHNISTLSHPTYVHLPDGSSQKVQESNITLAIGKLMENLYIIDKSSFCPEQQYPPSDNVPLPLIPLTADTISPTPCRPSSPIDPSTNSPPESPPSPAHSISLRRSTRQISKPGWLVDYECNCTSHSLLEPRTYSQACKNPHWVEAMEKELYALENNETWELTTLPRDKKAIGSKWVFKLKMNPDGSVERYKARLVGDDILLTGSSTTDIDVVKTYLDRLFTIKDLGPAKYFLGLQLASILEHLTGLLLSMSSDISKAQFLWDCSFLLTVLYSFQLILTLHGLLAWTPEDLSRGSAFFLGSSLISWKTKKQATVSRSSAEAEYRSMGSTVCELLWISYILRELQVDLQLPIPLWCDNKAALHITANPVFHERTKHLDIDCHLVRDQFKLGFIAPAHVPGSQQIADVFTKAVSVNDFTRLIGKLGLIVSSLRGGCGNTGLSLT